MINIKYDSNYLMDMVDTYLKSDLRNKNTNGGKSLTNMFNNDQPIRPINRDKYSDFFRMLQKDCEHYHGLTSNDQEELRKILKKIMAPDNYITLSSEIIYGAQPMDNLEHEFIMYARGENLPDALNGVYTSLVNSEIPFTIVAKVKDEESCVYPISVLTNDKYFERTRMVLDFLYIDELLIKRNVFGAKLNDYIEYDNLNLKDGRTANTLVGSIVIKSMIEAVLDWTIKNPEPEIFGQKIYDYINNSTNKDEALINTVKFVESFGYSIRGEIQEILERRLVTEGLDLDNVFTFSKYMRTDDQEMISKFVDEQFEKRIPVEVTVKHEDEVKDEIEEIVEEYMNPTEKVSEVDPLINEAIYSSSVEKYDGLVGYSDLKSIVKSGENLVEYLDNNHTLELIPLDSKVYLDDGSVMSGYDFISTRVIPAAMHLGHTSVQETLDKYASGNVERKDTKKKRRRLLGK